MEVRLDRGLASDSWMAIYPLVKLTKLGFSSSDYCPIYLQLVLDETRRRVRRFQFENAWLRESSCRDVVRNCWTTACGNIQEKVKECVENLSSWGSKLTENFGKRLRKCTETVADLRGRRDSEGVCLFQIAQTRLNETLAQKEVHWRQRRKQLWLQSGDRNTKFFHASASARRRHNRFNSLKNANGEDVTWETEHNEFLLRPIEKKDVKTAMFQMHPDKYQIRMG